MFQATTVLGFPINWLGAKHNQILTILLIHYKPLKIIEQNLPSKQKLKHLLQQHNGLPLHCQQYIRTFQQEMQRLIIT